MNLGTADTVKIDSDEAGFELHIATDEGEFVVNIHPCAMQLMQQVDLQLRPYWAEAEAAYYEWKQRVFACDPDESGGYDTSDPKHPDWHSVHADLYDSRDKG